MRLHEAIEEAGPGGKGFNTERGIDFTIDGNGYVTWPNRSPNIKDFESDDWEVVSPDIQVGDVVDYHGMEHTVTWARYARCETDNITIQYKDDIHFETTLGAVTFIRRPERHVFTGVVEYVERFTGVHINLNPMDIDTLNDNLDPKAYKTTLEEM
jgi:hypothetical protein